MHKELFGNSSPKTYGMSPNQLFFDLQERVVLAVKALTEYKGDMSISDYIQDFSITIGEEQEILLSKRYTPTNTKARRLVKTGWYFNPFIY